MSKLREIIRKIIKEERTMLGEDIFTPTSNDKPHIKKMLEFLDNADYKSAIDYFKTFGNSAIWNEIRNNKNFSKFSKFYTRVKGDD